MNRDFHPPRCLNPPVTAQNLQKRNFNIYDSSVKLDPNRYTCLYVHETYWNGIYIWVSIWDHETLTDRERMYVCMGVCIAFFSHLLLDYMSKWAEIWPVYHEPLSCCAASFFN